MYVKFGSIFSYFLKEEIAYAHCDIPCGIYDPAPLQIAAHTVLRMSQLYEEQKEDLHAIVRIVHVKEEHGEKVEDELGTLENDYFKPDHYEKYPELKKLIAEAVILSIKTRQKIDIELSQDLLEKCMLISEIFYKTKNVIPIRVKSLYPTGGEFVTYKE